ncbi:cpp24 [Campylobacter upsaliensis]|uniref:Cpp24 n=1 Tax=Campylobacter upsaliensis TaxID=28080 RepID=A0A381EIG1_CAMUP|nr:cpp24 [Campylobacter upsaliensis]
MNFNAIIEKDENGYFAYVPELKGCVSEGKSYEEAFCKKLVSFTCNLCKKKDL